MQLDRGAFIISFDCEGKWGIADKVNDRHVRVLTNENLNRAYCRLVALLEAYDMKATFAFVGGFVMSLTEYLEHSDWFHDVLIGGRNWLSRFNYDISSGIYDGWLNPDALAIVRASQNHEIGSHGFTHLPLSDAVICRGDFLQEMQGIRNVAALKRVAFQTLVYPRNNTGYLHELSAHNILGYRESLLKPGSKYEALRNTARELNVFQSAQQPKPVHDVVEIPSGYFLNWRNQFRKRIPISMTVQRWSHLISDAMENRRVVHLWSHPWNFLEGQQQFTLFERVLQVAARAVHQGKLDNLTQLEFCHLLRQQSGQSDLHSIAA